MDFAVPPGWEEESQTLYLHPSGVRIERRIYKSKEGWILVPVDLDRAVVEFPPDRGGLEQAFAAFDKGVLDPPDPGLTKEAQEARKAARRDEDPFESSADDEKDDEDEP